MAIDLGPDGLTLGSTTVSDWDDVGGTRVLLQSTDITSSTASITIGSSIITSTYRIYHFVGTEFRHSIDNNHWDFQVSANNGSSFITSGYYNQVMAVTGGSVSVVINESNNSSATFAGHGNVGNATNETFHFHLKLFVPHSTDYYRLWETSCVGHKYDGNVIHSTGGGEIRNSSDAFNCVKIFNNSGGNFTDGTLKVYGEL